MSPTSAYTNGYITRSDLINHQMRSAELKKEQERIAKAAAEAKDKNNE
jgi:hypothetical protein